jgi:hypothetical protein
MVVHLRYGRAIGLSVNCKWMLRAANEVQYLASQNLNNIHSHTSSNAEISRKDLTPRNPCTRTIESSRPGFPTIPEEALGAAWLTIQPVQ